MALIQFTRNYEDPNTDQGFQFEFLCDRYVNGFKYCPEWGASQS